MTDALSSAILEHAASMRREADRILAISQLKASAMEAETQRDPFVFPTDRWIKLAREASFLRGQAFVLRAHAAAIEGLAMGGESFLELIERAHTVESIETTKQRSKQS